MQAKYATRCAACEQRIEPGAEITKAAGGTAWVHATCPGGGTRAVTTGSSAAGSSAAGSSSAGSSSDATSGGVGVPAGTTEVFTDGACRGNPGPGGWAWAVAGGPQGSGHEAPSTNQRMEVRAAYEAIRALTGPLVVVSDSTYVVNCFKNSWWTGWRARGWLNSAKKPVANRDLWEPLVDLVEERGDVGFRWVKGHSGDPMNDLVDRLAVEASHRAE